MIIIKTQRKKNQKAFLLPTEIENNNGESKEKS